MPAEPSGLPEPLRTAVDADSILRQFLPQFVAELPPIVAAVVDRLDRREMADLAGHPVAEACNAFSLVDKLADKPLLVVNGETDPRVDEKQMFAFFAQLTARSRRCPPEIYIAPGVSHGWTVPTDAGYNAALGFLFGWCAKWMKHPLPEPAK